MQCSTSKIVSKALEVSLIQAASNCNKKLEEIRSIAVQLEEKCIFTSEVKEISKKGKKLKNYINAYKM